MVLVISNNYEVKKLISKYIENKDIFLERKVEEFSSYLDKELMSRKNELLERIIIDINSFKDNEEDILKSVLKIKVIYNVQIIIVAIGYKVGNELLSELFNNGIYDFIISEEDSSQDEEFRKALARNSYIDSIKFKNEKRDTRLKNIKVSKIKMKKEKINQNLNIKALIITFKNVFLGVVQALKYILAMFLISVGVTALINANIREILIQIIGGNIR